MNNVIQTHQLCKQFKNSVGIKSIDFTLKRGEICALIGRNGAGKSTFFKMLSGQLLPSSGELSLFEKQGKDLLVARKQIGFMIESPQFFDHFSASQNLEYFRLQRGVVERQRIDEVLSLVGLSQQADKKFRNFSMGMKQRLGLALSLLASPDCLILDEPINGLDAEGINEIRRLLVRLNQKEKITLLISSHILSELQLIATRFVFINKGELVEDLSRQGLLEKSKKQLRLRVSDTSLAVQLLERAYPDIMLQVLPDRWLTIQNHFEDRSAINQLLNNGNVLVEEFSLEKNNLEDYFFELLEVSDK